MRFFRIPAFTGIEAHRDDADRGSLRVVEGCLPYGPGGLRSGPVWKKVGAVSSLNAEDENKLFAVDDGKGNSAMMVSRLNEIHDLAVLSTENTYIESFGTEYVVVDPVDLYREGNAVLAPVGNQLYSFGDGDGEAVFVGKTGAGGVFPDEKLYSYEWSRFPNCKFFVQGPKKTLYAAGNPDQPLRVYISEPASKTAPFKDSPYSTEEPAGGAYGGLLSVVDIIGSNATEITALSSRGDQVVVHTNKGCHLLYAPTSDQADTGYRVEQAPATNFSAAVSSQVVAGETGSMSFWLGHDGQIYKDESASRGAEDVKSYADPAQVSWKAKSVWEKELHYDLRDSFAAYDRQSGMYWIYVLAPEYLETIGDTRPGLVIDLEALPELPGQIKDLDAKGSGLPSQIKDFDARPVRPGNISDFVAQPRLPGQIKDLKAGLEIPSFIRDLVANPPLPGQIKITEVLPVEPGNVSDLEVMPPKPGQIDLDAKPELPGNVDAIESKPELPGQVKDVDAFGRPGKVPNLDVKPPKPGQIDLNAEPVRPGNLSSIDAKPPRPGQIKAFSCSEPEPGRVGQPIASPDKPKGGISLDAKPVRPDRVTIFDAKPDLPGRVENLDADIEQEKLGTPVLTLHVPDYMDPEEMNFAADWTHVPNANYPLGYELQLDDLHTSNANLFDPPLENYTPDLPGMNFTNMDYNTTYVVRVRAKGYGHRYLDGDWSPVRSFQTPKKKLAVPENLKAFYSVFNEDPGRDITVTWRNNDEADYHQLQISTDPNFSSVLINHTQYRDVALFIEEEPGSRLVPDTVYYVRIKCYDPDVGLEDSDWSETAAYRTAAVPYKITQFNVSPATKPGTVTNVDAFQDPNYKNCVDNDVHAWWYNPNTDGEYDGYDDNPLNTNNLLYLTHIKVGSYGGAGAYVQASGRYSGFGCGTLNRIPRTIDDAIGSGRESLHNPAYSQGFFNRNNPDSTQFFWDSSAWPNIPVGGGVARWCGRYCKKTAGIITRTFQNVYQYWAPGRPSTRANSYNNPQYLHQPDTSSTARVYEWDVIKRHDDFGPDWREFTATLYPSLDNGGRYMISIRFGSVLYGTYMNVTGTGCQITGEYRARPNTATPDDLSFWLGMRPFGSDGFSHRGGGYHSDGSTFTLPVNTTEFPWL